MAKKKEDIKENTQPEEEKVESKKDVKVKEIPLTIEMFIKQNKQTAGANNSYAAGFRVWYSLSEKYKEEIYARHSFEEWETIYKEYLSSPVKN